MGNPSSPVQASFPIPPPAFPLGFVELQGNTGYLTPSALEFLQKLWAALQGQGGVFEGLLLDLPTVGQLGSVDGRARAAQELALELLGRPPPRTAAPSVWAPTVGTPGRQPFSGEELFNIPITFPVALPNNFLGSIGNCEVAATSSTTFQLFKNGTNIGSVVYPAGAGGSNVATFTNTGPLTFFPPNDHFSMSAPVSADPTLSGIGVQFLGTIL